jgi:PII-like signaling protein
MATGYQLVCIYLNESDEWEGRPLHEAILEFLNRSGCAGGTVLPALAGFTAGASAPVAAAEELQGRRPLVVQFIDRAGQVAHVLPTLRHMAKQRLITLQEVQVILPQLESL